LFDFSHKTKQKKKEKPKTQKPTRVWRPFDSELIVGIEYCFIFWVDPSSKGVAASHNRETEDMFIYIFTKKSKSSFICRKLQLNINEFTEFNGK